MLATTACGDDTVTPDAADGSARIVSIDPAPGTALGHGDVVRVKFDRTVSLSPGSHVPALYCCDAMYGTSSFFLQCDPSVDGDTLAFRLSLGRESDATCEVRLLEALVHPSNEPMSWTYAVVDKLPPWASYTPPAAGQPVASPITVALSEPVTGVSASSVLVEANGTPVAGTAAATDTTLTFTPTSPLSPATTYTVTLTTAITDLAGNALTSSYGEGSFDIPAPEPYVFTVETAP